MLKKFYTLSFFLIFLSFNLFSQNEELKYYSDYSTGFKGYASAMFLGNLKELDNISAKDFFELIEEHIGTKVNTISKITKQNTWLLNKSMNEWDYEKDEVYIVLCAESMDSEKGIFFYVIPKGKDDLMWRAFEVTEDTDFENLFPKF